MTIVKKLGEFLIVALIVINALELGLFFKIRRSAGLYSSEPSFPVPSGYLMDKNYMAADGEPCYLIRVSADGCPYCRLDQHQYTQLVQQAQKVRCRTILLAPKTGEVKWNGNSGSIMQLQYVDMKLGRVLNPYMTPQTILLDKNGSIVWDQEGSMDDGALSAATRALRKIH